MVQVNVAVLDHRVAELERRYDVGMREMELRVRALELAWSKAIGLGAGGAVVGGLVFQVLQFLLTK